MAESATPQLAAAAAAAAGLLSQASASAASRATPVLAWLTAGAAMETVFQTLLSMPLAACPLAFHAWLVLKNLLCCAVQLPLWVVTGVLVLDAGVGLAHARPGSRYWTRQERARLHVRLARAALALLAVGVTQALLRAAQPRLFYHSASWHASRAAAADTALLCLSGAALLDACCRVWCACAAEQRRPPPLSALATALAVVAFVENLAALLFFQPLRARVPLAWAALCLVAA